ncbi:Glycosyltransferases involved in cell wall biogenesis [Polynucleobacter duraquae]|uniref:Glycosyltransferases involved in cell wall biogenesis n=1 Tax=Polynucleobacter duraquae TaxID=1835254 RepID=A0A0E3ZJR3_9BURK|nr:glycosyltransferase family A protein [Polynucleobacter duraquae]AKD25237.1 Glycosyltransferases involved in cell wall biogenesis [Polynucleobacter duraquae]
MALVLLNQTLESAKNYLLKLSPKEHCILIDNASTDKLWDWVSKKAVTQINLTVVRNRKRKNLKFNIKNALRLVKSGETILIKDGLNTVPHKFYNNFLFKSYIELGGFYKNSLVSITLHNYCYGKYLRKCLTSLVEQTYQNIEILFSDNASNDDSWAIACEFAEKYPKKITLTRNNINKGPKANLENCLVHVSGHYRIEMCSDDYLEPNCIERAVKTFKKYPQIGFVMFHRNIVDDQGVISKEKPFYDGSYLIDGVDQAAVYMMAAVNPSVSQIVYDTAKAAKSDSEDSVVSRWWGARIRDFKMCLDYPIAYISEPLLGHRDHPLSDSKSTENSMLEIFGPLLMCHSFVEMSNYHPKVVKKFDQSIEKLATLSLRYASRAIARKDFKLAKRYFHLSRSLSSDIEGLKLFKMLDGLFNEVDVDKKQLIITAILALEGNLTRTKSYLPPKGSRKLMI